MKVISAAVGIVLLMASLILAYLSNSNATEMLAKKDAIVMSYIQKSNDALEVEDLKGAIKFVKLAIQVDPKSKVAFKTYESIMETKYKPAQSEDDGEDSSSNEAPSADDEEEEEDMGC